MAEPNSTRTSSRRNTPQPVPESSTRTTRATRSQSHEVIDNDAPRYSERVQRKPGKASAAGEQGAGQTATKGRKRKPPDQPDLSTVSEHPSVVIESGIGRGDQAVESDQLPAIDAKSSGRISGISGTTARTSNSGQELADLASEDLNVLDALPDLLESSKKFLSGLVPPELSINAISRVRSGLQDKRSGLSRRGNRFKVDLESCLPDQSSTFVDMSRALPKLYGRESSQEPQHQRPESVFHAANLAILASNILLYPHQENKSFLEHLDASFPKAFTNDGIGALSLEVETRTQYAIMQLSHYMGQPNFDHDIILKQVLFKDDGKTPRGFDIAAPRSKEAKMARKLMLKRVQDIRQFWNDENSSSPIERLRDVYGWDKYLAQMMAWVSERNEEVKVQLDPIEIEDVVQALKSALQAMRPTRQPSSGDGEADMESGQVDLSGFVPPSDPMNATGQPDGRYAQPATRERELAGSEYLNLGSPRLAHGAKSMKRAMAKHLKASKAAQQNSRDQRTPAEEGLQLASTAEPAARAATPKQNKAQQIPSSAPAKIREDRGPNVDVDDWRPQDDDNQEDEADEDDDDEDEAFQTQSHNADRALQLREQREAESNKENQAESSQVQARKSLIDRQAGAEKVSWDDSSQELSQDAGFQQPHHRPSSDRHALRPINKRNAPELPPTTGRSPPKRTRFQETLPGDHDDEGQAPQQPPRASQVYNIANEAAKQMTALQPKAPQSRKPWSEEETETLLELIDTFGISWKLLKIEDERRLSILENRDQVALKDKARNMKFDYLKAGRRLPRNFDKIALSKLLIDKLSGVGIVYDPITGQREDAEE